MLPTEGNIIVADLGFGDCGKGTVVDFLASQREFAACIRFNGGAQAAHNVVLPDGRSHTFSQFGSAAFHQVPTHLSRFMLVNPYLLAHEADDLAANGVDDPFHMITVDKRALVTTPYHRKANQMREKLRGERAHGSCGMGIGETMNFASLFPPMAIRVQDCSDPDVLLNKLNLLRMWYEHEFFGDDKARKTLEYLGLSYDREKWGMPEHFPSVDEIIETFLAFANCIEIVDEDWLPNLMQKKDCIFEAAQGVLLDEWYGFHPYTTWSTTTFSNAENLLFEDLALTGYKLGVVRTYTTRHGAGPHPTEDFTLDEILPEEHNGTGKWQGKWRVGHFDLVAHRYAVEVAKPDGLAITHLDKVDHRMKMCDRYVTKAGVELQDIQPSPTHDHAYQEGLTDLLYNVKPHYRPVSDWIREISAGLDVPAVLASYGKTWQDKVLLPANV